MPIIDSNLWQSRNISVPCAWWKLNQWNTCSFTVVLRSSYGGLSSAGSTIVGALPSSLVHPFTAWKVGVGPLRARSMWRASFRTTAWDIWREIVDALKVNYPVSFC